jgi:hypothetical protein
MNNMVCLGMETEHKPVKRTVSLSHKTNEDLKLLTSALGVNAHSYMVNEIAKAIQRDSLALKIKDDTNEQISGMMKIISSALRDGD